MVKLGKAAVTFVDGGPPTGSVPSTSGGQDSKNMLPVHYIHELPLADEERLEDLFKTLDRDGNGRIDIHDLSAALKDIGLSDTYAEVSHFY